MLTDIISFLAEKLAVTQTADASLNGLQIENNGKVTRVATAVDASLELAQKCAAQKADLAICHHGLFWKSAVAVKGRYYKIIKTFIENNIALAAYHLPLDIHPQLGNNISLIRALELQFSETTGNYHGVPLLFTARPFGEISFSDLTLRFREKIGEPLGVLSFANEKAPVKKIAVCSGGGLSLLEDAVAADCDTFITGDIKHDIYHQARESGIRILSGGHYQTETFGVKNIGQLLQEKFDISAEFIDIPTQL